MTEGVILTGKVDFPHIHLFIARSCSLAQSDTESHDSPPYLLVKLCGKLGTLERFRFLVFEPL